MARCRHGATRNFLVQRHHQTMHRICHIITGLNVGGAERHLAALLSRLEAGPDDADGGDRQSSAAGGFHNEVISLLEPGAMAAELGRIPVFSLGMDRGLSAPHKWPGAMRRLARLLESRPPDLVQTWMYHADLAGAAAIRLAHWPGKKPPLVWGLRNAYVSKGAVRLSTRGVITMLALLSRRRSSGPAAIIAPSQTAVRIHAKLGYAANTLAVIPSGVDTDRFRPDAGARARLLDAAGIADPDVLLVGFVSRWDPVKDVPGFLAALAALPEDMTPRVRAVLMGTGLNRENRELAAMVDTHPLKQSIRLLGVRGDLPALLPGLDVAVNSSRGESLPMAVLEAMSCGVACVVTDVGDSAIAVGKTGFVAPPGDAGALASAMAAVLRLPDEERRGLGSAARERALLEYGLDRSAARYAALYRTLIAGRGLTEFI
ncbi:group 1 glycosyl transferase [Oceanidesulfovibrio marinus]|uniref:Group 1 glycosyl transferase n=2 Tax=Oceanidesulfovibrio marinus TaxID=370038 RepID=A0A6P1ZGF8_9BACT|nr:group 1 glycosyl transferase [Oceanidesulfovibrio marinus]